MAEIGEPGGIRTMDTPIPQEAAFSPLPNGRSAILPEV